MLYRWISAICAIALLIGVLYFTGTHGLMILSSIVVFIVAVEYAALFETINPWSYLFLFFNTLIYSCHLFFPDWSMALLGFIFINLTSFGILFYHTETPTIILTKIQWTLWGIIYTGLFPAMGVQLLLTKGHHPLFFLLITVFAGDTLALFSGKYFGHTKLFPHISPKKTIAGAVGGLFGSCLAGSIYLYQFSPQTRFDLGLVLCLSLGFFAQFGDFFESLIKRVSGKKDTGKIMPGHGGLLDRVDGVYFAAAALYFFLTVTGSQDFF